MAKVLPTSYEKSVIEQLDAAAMGCEGPRKRGHRKRPKGPNPLSVKRSSKMKHKAHTPDHSVVITRSQVRGWR